MAFLMACLPASAGDWPQFLGPQRNGVSSEKGLLLRWPKNGPPLVWEKEVGEGFSGPVVVGKQLILFHRQDKAEIVESLDALTGKSQWKFSYGTAYQDAYSKGDGPRATPLVAGEHIYTLGAEGKLYCFDMSGKKVWSRSLADDYELRKGFFGIATSPLFEDGKVIVNVGGVNAGIVAFDAKNGKEVWKATDDEASYSSPVAAAIDGVRHVFVITRAGLVSLDPRNGAVRFRKPFRARLEASVNAAAPVVVDDLLFLSAEYGAGAVVFTVKKDGVEEVWKSGTTLSNHYNTSVQHGGFLYGIDGRQEGGAARLRCVELKTGKVRWEKEQFGCASLIVVDGQLLALREAGDLVLIAATPDGYRESARAKVLAAPVRAEIALANGRLYARDNRKLICLDLRARK